MGKTFDLMLSTTVVYFNSVLGIPKDSGQNECMVRLLFFKYCTGSSKGVIKGIR